MTPKNFIDQVRELYLARKEKREIAPGIYRGTNPSVSSETEDLFARYLKERLPDTVEIWVDPQISYEAEDTDKKGRRIFRPDICVIRDNTVTGAFELKMDLGYIREEFPPYAEGRAAMLRELGGEKGSITKRDPPEIRFAGGLVMNFVLINDNNISRPKLRKVEDYFAATPPGPLFIL
ncbi:MAG: hypothetical protein LBO65_01190, partial [Spirochaetaceae bacterium]|nr:hypothetical protein [Spirochaetaceae bacterium]